VHGIHQNASFNTKYVILFSFEHRTPFLVGGQVCSSLYGKDKNTSKGNNNTCEVPQPEDPPLASNSGTQLHTEMYRCAWDLNRWFSSHLNIAHLVFFVGRVCSSLDAKGKNTTIFNNIICEVFELEHPPLASKIEEHTCIMRRVKESGGERERIKI